MIQLHVLASFVLVLSPASIANQTPTPASTTAAQAVEAVQVPAFPNTTCPIMGKPISTRLFTDTQYGRIYICCKACVKDIQADVEHTYRTAYPTTEKLENKVCPVTGETVGKDAVRVELQGRDFLVANKAAAVVALEDAQATLAMLADPKLIDVKNGTCPTTGEPVARNTIAVIEGHIVRFATAKAIEMAKQDPKATLAKARELRAKEDRERAEKSPTPKPVGG